MYTLGEKCSLIETRKSFNEQKYYRIIFYFYRKFLFYCYISCFDVIKIITERY